MKAKVNKVNIEVIQGEILTLAVDGITVVTDPNLSISDTLLVLAGETVAHQTNQIGWCDVGQAVITNAGHLQNAQKIIHVVGPRWGEGSERGKLNNATWESLALAENNQLKSIVLPAISTGALGYPIESCARIMFSRIIDFTFENLKHLRTIILCVEDRTTFNIFVQEFRRQIEELRETGEGKVRV